MKKAALILILLSLPAFADLTIANSADWKNIYSAGIYSRLKGDEFRFLVSPAHAELILKEIPKNTQINVIESDKVPFMRKWAKLLESKGFTANTILIPEDSGNLDLAKRSGVRKFIIVDPTYGYDAISVAQYAINSGSYVIFADKENIQDVKNTLKNIQPESILIFGDVDDEVKESLAEYSPEILHKGSRFKNNIAIAERYRQEANSQQALLTNGEFLEYDIFAGGPHQSIIFIGKDNPPEEVVNYLKSAPFKTAVVLGNDLISSAQAVKNQLSIPVLIKFGKGTTGGSDYKHISGLDTYPVPVIDLLLTLKGIFYNTKTGNIELVIKNEKRSPTYFRSSIVVRADGQPVQTLGDDETLRLDDLQTQALEYAASFNPKGNLTADIFIPYGASEDALEKGIRASIPIKIVNDDNNCDISIEDAQYNKRTERFEVVVGSKGTCYAQASIAEITINGEQQTITGQEKKINGKKTLEVKASLSEVDIADNPEIKVRIDYGSREGILLKTKEKTFPLKIKKEIPITWIVIAVLLLIILLLTILLLWKNKKSSSRSSR